MDYPVLIHIAGRGLQKGKGDGFRARVTTNAKDHWCCRLWESAQLHPPQSIPPFSTALPQLFPEDAQGL